jgi:hypothetical protein
MKLFSNTLDAPRICEGGFDPVKYSRDASTNELCGLNALSDKVQSSSRLTRLCLESNIQYRWTTGNQAALGDRLGLGQPPTTLDNDPGRYTKPSHTAYTDFGPLCPRF